MNELLLVLLGFLAGATSTGVLYSRAATRWEVSRQLMEAGMIRLFERRLGVPRGSGRDALETWKAHGYGLARFNGVEATLTSFPLDDRD